MGKVAVSVSTWWPGDPKPFSLRLEIVLLWFCSSKGRLLRVPQSSAHLGYRQFPSSLSWIAQHTDFHLKSADSRNPPWSHRCALPHPCRHCPRVTKPLSMDPKELGKSFLRTMEPALAIWSGSTRRNCPHRPYLLKNTHASIIPDSKVHRS